MSDVLTGGSPEGRQPTARWVLILGLVVVAVAALALWHSRGGSAPSAPAAAPSSAPAASPGRAAATAPSGPAFSCARLAARAASTQPPPRASVTAMALQAAPSPGGALDRRDTRATSGPWAVVVRRPGGSLGRGGAVVTFPVNDTPLGRAVRVGDGAGRVTTGEVIWSITGGRARVRGDLSEAALLRIAAATRITSGRPTVHPPAGYRVVRTGPYRSPHIRELRYGGAQLAASRVIGGLVYTGVTTGIDFEDQLFASYAAPCGTVHGSPAVVSRVGGGNGTIAWQPAPGLVGYVGYSSSELSSSVVEALHGLAESARYLDAARWLAAKPQVIDQLNDAG